MSFSKFAYIVFTCDLATINILRARAELQEHDGVLFKTSGFVSLETFKMYYVMRVSVPSLHRESTDSLIMYMYVH